MKKRLREILKSYITQSDEDLLRIIRSSVSSPLAKGRATHVLLDRYKPVILRTVNPILKDEHRAEGVVNWIFWRCVRLFNHDKPNRRFSAYVCRAAHNEAINEIRRNCRLVAEEDMEVYTASPAPERDHLLLERLEKLLDSFPNQYRETFTLRYLDGRSWAEIEPHPVKQGSLRVQSSRNRRRMRKILMSEGITPGARPTDSQST